MGPIKPEKPPKSNNRFEGPVSESELQHTLLSAIAHSGTIGFAVCDHRLRFRAVNSAWIQMHGVAREAHLGATIHEVFGPAAEAFELPFKKVFSTGKPLLNYGISAELRTRIGEGHWIGSCFPIEARPKGAKLAAAVVLEITQLRRLEVWSRKLLSDSVRVLDSLFETDQFLGVALAKMAKPGRPTEGLETEKLSPRERQVIQLLAQGKTNKEVAEALGISVRTIETHRMKIMLKLRIHSLSELIHYAIRSGIVEA